MDPSIHPGMCFLLQPSLVDLIYSTLLYTVPVTAVMVWSVLTEASDGVVVDVGWYLDGRALGLSLLVIEESESLKAGHRTPCSQTPAHRQSRTVQGLQLQLRRQGHYTSHEREKCEINNHSESISVKGMFHKM